MSTIIIITPPPKKPKLTLEALAAEDQRKIRIEVDDNGTLADRLRAAADALDGVP